MTYELVIGDRSFSSWSLRGWLMFEKFGLPFRTRMAGLYSGTFAEDLSAYPPARFVPLMKTPEGTVIGDTLAMAETLAERHPQAGLWPGAADARALARWLVAEMHSGFGALRADCPMYLRHAWSGFQASEEVKADLSRLETLWDAAWAQFGQADSPWLFGDYSLADVFYAPVATRIATYGLPVSDRAQGYVAAHLADPAFRRWRAEGGAVSYETMPYRQTLATTPWPGPVPRPAKAVEAGASENADCPFSGKPVSHFLETGGRVIGFCNAGCRDKVVEDPDAFPEVAALLER